MFKRVFAAVAAVVAGALGRGSAPVTTGEGKFYTNKEFLAKFRPTSRGRISSNKYEPIAGGGPGAAARRVKAMVRNGTASAATIAEYERHVANGNVYKRVL